MPRELENLNAIQANYSEEVDLVLATIYHPTIASINAGDPIRVVNDTQDLIWNGNTYIGFPFDISLLTDDDSPPKAQLSVQNVDQIVGTAIRQLSSPPRMRIELLSSTSFFTRRILRPKLLEASAYFEAGNGSELGGSSLGSVTYSSTITKDSDFSIKFAAEDQPGYRETTSVSQRHSVFSFDMYMEAIPGDDFTQFAAVVNSGDTDIIDLYIDSAGFGSVVLDGTPIGATSRIISPAKWHKFELRVFIHATRGEIELWQDGNQVFFQQSLNTAAHGPIARGLIAAVGQSVSPDLPKVDFYFDNLELYSLDQSYYFTGFETGDKTELGGTSAGTSLVKSGISRNGTYGLMFNNFIGEVRGTLTGGSNSITNPIDATGSVAISVGDLIVAVIGEQTALTVTAVTDNLGNTYTAQNAGTDAGNTTGRMFYAYVTVPGTLTAVHFAATASADDVSCCAAVFEGPFTTSPLDKSPANRSNDTSNPMTSNATGTLSTGRELIIGWFAGADGTAGIDTSGDDSDIVVSQRQSANIETAISSIVVNTTASYTSGFSTPGTIGNNVIGTASFRGSTTNSPYVESTTGLNLTEARLRFYVYWAGTLPDNATIAGFANSSDVTIADIFVFNDDGFRSPAIYLAPLDDDYSFETGSFTAETWHLFELYVKIHATEGELKLWMDGELVAAKSGIATNGNGNIDRAFLEPNLSNDGTFFAYDDFEILNLGGNINPDVMYTADKLYLQNAKVDALNVTADITGWDFLQRVWPPIRADQQYFPGLFR